VAHRFHPPAVNIDGITHRLKRVEADSEWQKDAQGPVGDRQTNPAEEARRRGEKEIEVFEEREDPEVHGEADEQPPLARAIVRGVGNAQTDDEIHARRTHQDGRKPPSLRQWLMEADFFEKAPRIADKKTGVKKMAAAEEPRFAPRVAAQRPMHREDDEKK
jgi:hypothetical protein